METLDCGHANDWTPGFGCRDSDDRSLCKVCAHARELRALATADRAFGYLSGDTRTITDWSELPLARVLSHKVRTMYGFGGKHTRHYFRAIDATGQVWSGSGPGPNMYVRMRRVKGPLRPDLAKALL